MLVVRKKKEFIQLTHTGRKEFVRTLFPLVTKLDQMTTKLFHFMIAKCHFATAVGEFKQQKEEEQN